MVVGVGLLINAVLVAIPVGGSVGALMGIDAHRAATGQKPLFTGGTNEDGTGAGTGAGTGGGSTGGGSDAIPHDNGITSVQHCDLSYGIMPPSKTEQYTLNPNQWGVKQGENDGSLCMDVQFWNNETYSTNTAPEFSVTWQFDQASSSAPVHGYPNIRVDKVLPKAMDEVTELYVDIHWTYGVGNTGAETTDVDALKELNLATNVAIDMFLDSDQDKAENGTDAKFEVMVWFYMSSETAQPLGWGKPGVNRTIGGTEFTLYTGINDQQTNVLSWVANPPITDALEKFTGDIYPLITDLYNMDGDIYPAKNDYLGSLSFGSEVYSVDKNVTFWVPKYEIAVKT